MQKILMDQELPSFFCCIVLLVAEMVKVIKFQKIIMVCKFDILRAVDMLRIE